LYCISFTGRVFFYSFIVSSFIVYVAVHHKISRKSPGGASCKLTRISSKHYQSSYSV